MKNLNLACFIFLLFFCKSGEIYAQNTDWLWVQQTNGSGNETGKGVIVDQKQNAYFIGTFSSSITLGSKTLTSNGSTDVYLAKYDENGNVLWAVSGGGTGNESIKGVTADRDGNAYIIGSFSSVANFGGKTVSSNGNNDIYVAKYTSNGDIVWLKSFGSASYDDGVAISADSQSKVVIAGSFASSINIDGHLLTCNGISSFFIAKFDSSGVFDWAFNPVKGKYNSIAAIETNWYGDIYATGQFMDTMEFDSTTVVSAGQSDVFLFKLGSSGNLNWVKTGSGSLQGYPNGMCLNENGDIYITGTFLGTINFEGKSITSFNNDYVDIFLVKYGEDGSVYWATGAGGSNYDQGMDVCVDRVNNTYVTGFFNNSATIGSSTITSNGSNDIFVAKFNSAGIAEWAKSAGDYDYDVGYGIAINCNKKIFVTGVFKGSCKFGNFTLNSGSSSSDAFLGVIGSAVPSTINIIIQPVGKDVCYSDEVTFEVLATGTNLSYQWKRDNLPINGADSSAYTIYSAGFIDAGTYTCELKDATSSLTTNNAVLTVDSTPVIISQPVSQTVKLGKPVSFTVNAGGGEVNFQWFKNNIPITNATLFQYTIASAKYSDSGSYRCAIFNDCGDTVSNEVFLKVNPATGIIVPASDIKIDIYPNPASEIINISFNNNIVTGSVQLSNLSGKIITEKAFANEKAISLDTKILPKGYYFVKIRFDKHIKLEKIFIK